MSWFERLVEVLAPETKDDSNSTAMMVARGLGDTANALTSNIGLVNAAIEAGKFANLGISGGNSPSMGGLGVMNLQANLPGATQEALEARVAQNNRTPD